MNKYFRVLAEHGNMTTGQIASHLKVLVSTATVGVALLKRQELIERKGEVKPTRRHRKPVAVWGIK